MYCGVLTNKDNYMIEKQSISVEEIELSPEFLRALDILQNSTDNLFITGKAGTGKSTFLEYFRKQTKKNVAVLAPTGVAALNVKGQTIHSFFKFKPHLLTKDSIKIKRDRKLFSKLDMLIIDEISMVRADVFDAIEYFLRLNGPKQGQPFGGVQICVIGDLYQLSPIVSYAEREIFHQLYKTPFFFSSDAFALANFGVVELKKIYRQSEGDFIEALNKIRTGDSGRATIDFINQRYGKAGLEADTQVVLTTTNLIADSINSRKLAELSTPEYIYQGTLTGDFGLDNDKLPAPQTLRLKVGAQVMFTKNHQSKRWVNGTIGIVTSLTAKEIVVTTKKNDKIYSYTVEKETWETVRYSYDEALSTINEEVKGEYSQYPLTPAWGITIHKSQGKTLESVVLDLGSGAFAPGQLYVALSRCRTFDNITLKNPISPRDVRCDINVVNFSKEFVG
jgi:ATP-dependent DNA helicase PIF1